MTRSEPFVIHESECELESWDPPGGGKASWRTLVSADRTPTDSLTVGVGELEAGGTSRSYPHRHAQPEIYYILSGQGVVSIEGRSYPLRAGSVVFVPGNAEHDLRNTGSELLRLLYVFPAASFDEVDYQFSRS